MNLIKRVLGYTEPHPIDRIDREHRVERAIKISKDSQREARLAALKAQATVADGRKRLLEGGH